MVYLFFLRKNWSAGQPMSRCLQYLQAKEPRINAGPPRERIRNRVIMPIRIREKSRMVRMMPPTMGNMATRKSGSKSVMVTVFSVKRVGFPFFVSAPAIFPFPRPHTRL